MKSSSEDRPSEDAIRERRVELARRNTSWTELQEPDLVRRGRVLVHAQSDEVFAVHRGTIFARGSASISFQETVAMWFYVDRAGEIVFLERKSGTWSERVARQAQIQMRRTAPRRPMRRGAA